ncbi:MAG TPA: Mu transposase C-terminal domain-containing protein [Azospirillum sp.]|nr:Mu transposase C-terminal domain-containing protein [Azospirillum sp.]
MDESWYTASELAFFALPGLPSTKRGINMRAQQERWSPARPRQGRGGGTEYHVTALPPEARIELGRRAAEQATPPAPPKLAATLKGTAAAPVVLTKAGKARLDAKATIANAFLAFERQAGGLSRDRLVHKFTGFYNAREVDVPDWARAAKPTVSPSSLRRWVEAVESGEAARLAGAYGNRKGAGSLDQAREDIMGYLVAVALAKPDWNADAYRAALVKRFGEGFELLRGGQAKMPTAGWIRRRLNQWREEYKQLHLRLTNPDAWKNRSLVAVGSYSEAITKPNELWEIDASPTDLMLTDGRHTIYVVVDVFTRRMLILVTKVPRASAVLLLIRRAILAWGMPEAIKTDNGSDFLARETQRFFALVGDAIRHPVCTPYSPEQKPHVERAIGTVQHGLMPLLPGYTGHNVAKRQEIRSRQTFAARLGQKDEEVFEAALPAAELQMLADAWVENRYHTSPHAGLGDRTPAAVAEEHAGSEWRVVDERQLDLLLMPCADGDGTRTVGKKGIRVENADFWAPELIPYVGTGDRLEVRLDPERMDRVFVYRPDPFQFLCIAQNPERAGLSRAELSAQAKALQQQLIADQKAAIRAAGKGFKPHQLADALIGRPAATVSALPRSSLPPPSAGLEAAQRAITASKPAVAAPRTEADTVRQADVARRLAAPAQAAEKPEDRWWRRAQAIEARIEAGEEVSEDDLDWLASNRTSAWYQARRRDQERKARFARPVE